ncbi:MAG TPA: GrpB family protein [Planctomycetota bacterium]|jgi:GrpB-like predicted nucleotidyltransferase (UPF0157 family)
MGAPIDVVDYDKRWPQIFEALRLRVVTTLGSVALAVEHVGSTSVPGLAAKPIIDMDVVVGSEAAVPVAIQRLATLGYVHRGNLGVAGREAFQSPPDAPAHHLYVCAADAEALRRHLCFRNFLRAHPDEARAYAELKKTLALRFRNDRDAYTEAKTGFVLAVLKNGNRAQVTD